MKEDSAVFWGCLAAIIFAIVVLGFLVAAQAECEGKGGKYVRGLFFYECVF